MSAREFELQLDREWAEKLDDIHEFVSLVALYALRGVVNKSPVDTGRFKGNWQMSIGTPVVGTLQVVDKSGGATIAKGAAVVTGYSSIETFPPIWLTNNLPYASRLENGYSGQAPGGVLGLTVAEIQAAFDGKVI